MMTLRQKLNYATKKYGNKVISGLGDFLTTNIDKKGLESLILAGLISASTGCATIGVTKIKEPQIVHYQSEVVKKEWNFNLVDSRSNLINEAEYPKIEGNKLHIVGYSEPAVYEQTTGKLAFNNAKTKLLNLTNSKKLPGGLYPIEVEIHKLKKDGKIYFVAHRLFEYPLENLNEITQQKLREKYGNKEGYKSNDVLPLGEKIIGEVKFSHTNNEEGREFVAKTKMNSYQLTNLSAPIMEVFPKEKEYFESADVGFNGKEKTGKKDGIITGQEADTFYKWIKKELKEIK